ncbi:hypothetical protein COU60_02135 [Candidatus Pacearchaeota archaeon CG10_big_fil_rev_8_21_14_0_10_34_76]|nr:MAG: hypothetical protein COU60_02135 [Candidatus Pacearchaeota archaeon CG10_big_fil_rev_8_21_14_0_10_34_76]
MKNPKIAVVQFEINQYQPEKNLAKAEEFIKKAASRADLIVFPEDFITGPLIKKVEFADSSKKYVKFFQELAKKYNIDIVPGSIIEKDNFGLYNTTYYINSNGKILSEYQKNDVPPRLKRHGLKRHSFFGCSRNLSSSLT